jgi:uncharacterized protein
VDFTAEDQFRSSRYNFMIEAEDGRSVLYNARTGSTLLVEGEELAPLAEVMHDPAAITSPDQYPEELLGRLLSGGHLVAGATDELAEIRTAFWQARVESTQILTITTTMECNLGCYYCYETRSGASLRTTDVSSIVDLITAGRRGAEDRRGVHVDWYGGEPLLNLEFLEQASQQLIAYCDRHAIKYDASIISNGTVWPADIPGFIARQRIRQAQISFDGMKANHDKRRRYRKGFNVGASSFDQAVQVVDELVRCARVDIRFNTDRGNAEDLVPFIDFALARGWFEGDPAAVFQPARVSAYTDRSRFMENHRLSLAEFDKLRQVARERLEGRAKVDESQVPDGFPYPRSYVCAALAVDSSVIGADGLLYRCGLQVGERGRHVGDLAGRQDPGPDAAWWDAFDPTAQPNCNRCSFLPICWGGCPKKHLEGDPANLGEQGEYWRANLGRLVLARVGGRPKAGALSMADQFRAG